MRTTRLKRMLRSRFGRVPEPYYHDGDMKYIRAYYDYRKNHTSGGFLLDDITWNDLDMDRFFRRINPGRCTSGEQYLYYMLRCPALDEETYESRRRWIEYAQADEERRIEAEAILARLGCTRRADLCHAFAPEKQGIGMLLFYLVCLCFFLAAAVCACFHLWFGIRMFLASLLINCYVHEFGRRRSQRDYDTVNYIVNMVFAIRKLQKLSDPALDAQMKPAYESLERLKAVIRTGGIPTKMDSGGFEDAILTATLLDLITYEFLKRKLGYYHSDVFTIHESLGKLDAAISIASYRASIDYYVEPSLCFSGAGFLHATDLVHPLLSDAVPNDCTANQPFLITGGNASGKSTYLKTVLLAAVMAQSICTVLATSYEATAFCIYSSLASSDSLLTGASLYTAEVLSLKRILDAAKEHNAILCAVDEALRGTNTTERIAAGSVILQELADSGILCFAATHDLELCDLLKNRYQLYHFEEQIVDGEMMFDYRIHTGRTETCNAIRLLQLFGFDWRVIRRAKERVKHFQRDGVWLC